MTRLQIVMAIAAAFGSPGAPGSQSIPHAPLETPSPHPRWLSGSWMPLGAKCHADRTVHYRIDGSWTSGDRDGLWSINGNRLSVITLSMGRATEKKTVRRFGDQGIETLRRVSADRYSSQRSDGSTQVYVRCSSGL